MNTTALRSSLPCWAFNRRSSVWAACCSPISADVWPPLCWWYAYGAFVLFIPILFLVLMLPKGELSPPVKGSGLGELLNPSLLFYVGQSIVFAIFFYILQTNLALLVAERGLGGSELSGKILSCQSAVGIISGVLGGRVLGRLREFSLPVILACTGIAQLIVYFSGSAAPLFFAAGLIGFFFSIRMPRAI